MAIPIKIGNYRLGKTLGTGSFGKVKCKNPKFLLMIDNFDT